MKLGDFFVELGIKSDSKSLKAVQEHINALKKLQKEVQREIQYEKELAEAQTEEQKARVKKKFAIEKEIDAEEKNLKQQKASISNFKGMIRGAIGVATAVAGVVFAVDRMTTALARSNQKLMNFQHQTGISLSTLNKYASANVSVNPLASIEGTAGSLQALASNLWDIQLGRGDVSAFQELSYFSGQEVSVYGKTVEEVIESVRSALTKIPNDVQATNLIQRMGFSPDDLMMLRMSKKEIDEIQDIMLSPSMRKQMEKYGKDLNIIHLKIKTMYETLIIKLAPSFLKFMNSASNILSSLMLDIDVLGKGLNFIVDSIVKARYGLLAMFVAVAPQLSMIIGLFLVIEDIISAFAGKESYFGDFMNWLDKVSGKIADNFSKINSLISFITNPALAMGNIANSLALQGAGNIGGNIYNISNNVDLTTNNKDVANSTIDYVINRNYNKGN